MDKAMENCLYFWLCCGPLSVLGRFLWSSS